jgi:hypothetical protein
VSIPAAFGENVAFIETGSIGRAGQSVQGAVPLFVAGLYESENVAKVNSPLVSHPMMRYHIILQQFDEMRSRHAQKIGGPLCGNT